MLNQVEWLQRFRARFQTRLPELSPIEIARIANLDVFTRIRARFPADPERAADEHLVLLGGELGVLERYVASSRPPKRDPGSRA